MHILSRVKKNYFKIFIIRIHKTGHVNEGVKTSN